MRVMRRLVPALLALVVVPAASAAFSVTLNTPNVTATGVTLNGVDQTKTLPITKVAEFKPDPIRSDSWPKTEPLAEIDYNDYTSPMTDIMRVARMAHTPRVVRATRHSPNGDS